MLHTFIYEITKTNAPLLTRSSSPPLSDCPNIRTGLSNSNCVHAKHLKQSQAHIFLVTHHKERIAIQHCPWQQAVLECILWRLVMLRARRQKPPAGRNTRSPRNTMQSLPFTSLQELHPKFLMTPLSNQSPYSDLLSLITAS